MCGIIACVCVELVDIPRKRQAGVILSLGHTEAKADGGGGAQGHEWQGDFGSWPGDIICHVLQWPCHEHGKVHRSTLTSLLTVRHRSDWQRVHSHHNRSSPFGARAARCPCSRAHTPLAIPAPWDSQATRGSVNTGPGRDGAGFSRAPPLPCSAPPFRDSLLPSAYG